MKKIPKIWKNTEHYAVEKSNKPVICFKKGLHLRVLSDIMTMEQLLEGAVTYDETHNLPGVGSGAGVGIAGNDKCKRFCYGNYPHNF